MIAADGAVIPLAMSSALIPYGRRQVLPGRCQTPGPARAGDRQQVSHSILAGFDGPNLEVIDHTSRSPNVPHQTHNMGSIPRLHYLDPLRAGKQRAA